MSDQAAAIGERVRVRRHPERADYDRAAVHAILDEALMCHVGFQTDRGPVVIPTLHARVGDVVFIHGSAMSRMLRTLADGVDVCVTATLVDGLVLARAAFTHSFNYRSAVVFGRGHEVVDHDAKRAALEATVNHVLAGRWADVRQPSEAEMRATSIVAVRIDEASAKIRTGPPKDSAADHALDVWAGVIPLTTIVGAPLPADGLPSGLSAPAALASYVRADYRGR